MSDEKQLDVAERLGVEGRFLEDVARRVVSALRDVGVSDDRSLRVVAEVCMGTCTLTTQLKDQRGILLHSRTTRDPLIPTKDLLELSVDCLGLRARVVSALRRVAARMTVGQLVQFARADLLGVPGIGLKYVEEVEAVLAARNLSLGMRVVDGELRDVQLRIGLRGCA